MWHHDSTQTLECLNVVSTHVYLLDGGELDVGDSMQEGWMVYVIYVRETEPMVNY